MNDDKTEPATPKRRKKAREEGQVAKSTELVACVILLTAVQCIPGLGPGMSRGVSDFLVRAIEAAGRPDLGPAGLDGMMARSLLQTGMLLGPLLGLVAVGALAGNIAQVGLQFDQGLLAPKLARLDPFSGFKRLFAMRSMVELLKNVLKLLIVAWSGWSYLRGHWTGITELPGVSPAQVAPQVGSMAQAMAFQMVATLTLLAAVDYLYQRWQFERQLKMTKQEVKDEVKEQESSPEVKGRIRQRQRQMSRRRMMAEVPGASVVITNPTHFAVALKYELGRQGAPKVVARGQDRVALKIREIAEANRVPLVENPPLARALYRSAEIGDEIPSELYRAVAEILSMIWKLDARRRQG